LRTPRPGEVRVSFELEDRDGFRQRLLAVAVEAAHRNAATIAAAAGVRLGPIAGIEYGWSEVRAASPLVYESRAMRGVAAPTSFEPERSRARRRSRSPGRSGRHGGDT